MKLFLLCLLTVVVVKAIPRHATNKIRVYRGGLVSLESIHKALQAVVGDRPVFIIEPFINWAQTRTKSSVFAVRPRNVEEIQKVVEAAYALNLRVRTVGTRHSDSPLFPDEGQIALYTTDFNKGGLGRIKLCQGKELQVQVQAGVTNGQLKDFFLETGLQIPANVVITAASFIGVISTGSHGSGKDTKPVSGYVEKVSLVDGNAKIRTFSRDQNPNILRAIEANLGLFGIIYEVTIKVEAMKISESRSVYLQGSKSILDPQIMNNIIKTNWGVVINVIPFNSMDISCPQCLLAGNKTAIESWNPEDDLIFFRLTNFPEKPGDILNLGPEVTQQRAILRAATLELPTGLLSLVPSFISLWGPLRLAGQMRNLPNNTIFYEQLPNAIHFIPGLEGTPTRLSEWMFTLDDENGTEAVSNVYRIYMETIKEHALNNRYPLNNVGQMRFYGTSDGYIAPVGEAGNPDRNKNGLTFSLDLIAFGTVSDDDYRQFLVDVTRKWIEKGYRPVPHWGKGFDFIPDINNYLRSTYGENFDNFLEALCISEVDPKNMFFNQYLKNLFEI